MPTHSTRPITSHLGVEWQLMKYFAVRTGLDQSINPVAPGQTSWDPAYGISVGYTNFRFDYAYHPFYNDPSLANTYFSLMFSGDPWLAMKGEFK